MRLSRNILHGWKDNSMLAKPLAACAYLSIFNSFRLEVGPLNPVGGLGSAVSSPSGVWGRAPAEIEFCAF